MIGKGEMLLEKDTKRMRVVAENIKRLRKIKDLSQDKLGQKAMLSSSFLNQIENCKRDMTMESLCRVCIALDVTPNELLGFGVIDDKGGKEEYVHRFSRSIQGLREEEVSFVLDTLEDMCSNLKKCLNIYRESAIRSRNNTSSIADITRIKSNIE